MSMLLSCLGVRFRQLEVEGIMFVEVTALSYMGKGDTLMLVLVKRNKTTAECRWLCPSRLFASSA